MLQRAQVHNKLDRKLEFMELATSALFRCDLHNGRIRSRFDLRINGFGVELIDRLLREAGDYECVRYQMPEKEILQWMDDQDFKLESVHCGDPYGDGLGEEEFAIMLRAENKDSDDLLIKLRWWDEGLCAEDYEKTL